MNTQTLPTNAINNSKSYNFNFVNRINSIINQEKSNAIGISVILIMFGTGIASLTAALAVHGTVSIPILMVTTILAMGANAAAISLQPFKTIFWIFAISIIINTILLIYQVINLIA